MEISNNISSLFNTVCWGCGATDVEACLIQAEEFPRLIYLCKDHKEIIIEHFNQDEIDESLIN